MACLGSEKHVDDRIPSPAVEAAGEVLKGHTMVSLKYRLSVIRSRLFELLSGCYSLDDVSPMSNRPVVLNGYAVLQPDVVVARGSLRTYADLHPNANEAVVAIEISRPHVSSSTRLSLYAEARIPEYWIVNLIDKSVEVYTEPTSSGYDQIHVYRQGKFVPLSFAPGKSISVDDIVDLG